MRRIKRKKQKKILIIGTMLLLLFLCVGYAAFNTNLTLKARGNIKDIKTEVDKKVPDDELLLWIQADNNENTLTTLKDKSGNNNDGTLNNFDNTAASGFNNDELILDGVDDYVDFGFKAYDFQNSISYVVYIKMITITTNEHNIIIGNWYNYTGNSGGGGLYVHSDHRFIYDVAKEGHFFYPSTENIATTDTYYTIVGTFENNSAKIYVDGELKAEEITSDNALGISDGPVRIGAFTGNFPMNQLHHFGNFAIKEAMIYDRALTQEEVKTITEGFERKYKNS